MNNSEPEPDVAWVKRRRYSQHPGPSDVLLVVEVADSSVDFDRGEKLAIYAEAGIQEYWVVNLIDEQIEVYRSPFGSDYQDKSILRANDEVNPQALPSAALKPSRLFGE